MSLIYRILQRGMLGALGVVLLIGAPALVAADTTRVISYDELHAVMATQTGYEIMASTNSARFQAAVVLGVARQALAQKPNGEFLKIPYDVWFKAQLATANVDEKDAALSCRVSHQYKQDMLIDCRKGAVVKKVAIGPQPKLALNVKLYWPKTPGAAKSFTYRDETSDPVLEVTNAREVTFRVLDYGDFVVYDQMHGIRGRPSSGMLGVLFKAIGKGRVSHMRFTNLAKNRQLCRVLAHKLGLTKDVIITVEADGSATPGCDKADESAQKRLLRRLKLKYHRYAFPE